MMWRTFLTRLISQQISLAGIDGYCVGSLLLSKGLLTVEPDQDSEPEVCQARLRVLCRAGYTLHARG